MVATTGRGARVEEEDAGCHRRKKRLKGEKKKKKKKREREKERGGEKEKKEGVEGRLHKIGKRGEGGFKKAGGGKGKQPGAGLGFGG